MIIKTLRPSINFVFKSTNESIKYIFYKLDNFVKMDKKSK